MSRYIVMLASGNGTADPRIAKEAEALVAAGHRIVVLAWDRAGENPRVIEREGWRIEAHGPPARHGAGARNILGYRRYWTAAARRVAELKPDVVHAHNLDTVPAALKAMRLLGERPWLVLDFWEIYRESRALPGRGVVGVLARWAARRLERRSIPQADFVITVVQGQVYYYEELGAREVVVVENAPDLERYAVYGGPAASGEFVVGFIGQKRWVPSLETLMRAIQPYPDVRAVLVGGGPSEAEVARLAAGMERVETRGQVPPEEIPALYRTVDAVYACYDTSLLNWRTSLPVKAMEAMALGLPVLVSKGSWMGAFVEEHGIGYAVDDTDPADVGRAIADLATDREAAREMGRRGRAIAERELNWASAAGRLVDAYSRMERRDADA